MTSNITYNTIQCTKTRPNKEPEQVTLRWFTRVNNIEETWLWLIGGSTGYESVCITDEHVLERITKNGWHACAGNNIYPKIYINANEINRVIDIVKQDK